MMTIGGTAHISMLIASLVLSLFLFWFVAKSKEKVQYIMITIVGLIAVVGIFFLHGTHYFTKLDFYNLGKQMFQVCNFNFLLIPLALFQKNELARQYLFYFSMPAALSSFVTYPSDVENSTWNSVIALTFWINHLCIALTPILILAAKKFKPNVSYIPKVLLCILLYFGAAFFVNFALNGWQIDGSNNLSYTMNSGSIMILQPLYKLISIPYVYLLPLVPVITFIYYLVAWVFKKYNLVGSFGYTLKKKKRTED